MSFSCNTDALRNGICPSLTGVYHNLTAAAVIVSSLPNMEGCEGIASITGEIEREGTYIIQIKDSIDDFAEVVEGLNDNEKDLVDLIDWSGDRESGIQIYFKDDEILKVLPEEQIIDILAIIEDIDTRGKNQEQIIKEIAENYGVSLTQTAAEKFAEPPLYNQIGNPTPYGSLGYGKTIQSSGCGITITAMELSYQYNRTILPEDLVVRGEPGEWQANYNNRYIRGLGSSSLLFTEDIPRDWDLEVEECGTSQMDRVEEALRNGQHIGVSVKSNSPFTDGGHYILMTNITEDGKVFINDPNGSNYMSNNPTLVDGFENGFDLQNFKSWGYEFFIFPKKDPTRGDQDTIYEKTNSELLVDIFENGTKIEENVERVETEIQTEE